mmetsp:Transcript_5182/g.9866  ORF Transcript_5182/g.9866 Transcript_5182/m.9866 type:complete len:426 (+) Transcript_5182:169-1446(+)|eukprot:CAMPEP_0114252776 /NCGR_PEP_ID=MMETSP0058-20121206/16025_1 /TAXON_ID=36894 /ORGANISM="Pyramimonas parkeae, CCMP726" /LENGTH=425 /DNA_ID=CAMNT_0001366749 /DNA_START=113 /DNA_END=1390 /DNA_ORIENTATION=+
MTNIGLEDVGGPDSEFMALLNQYEAAGGSLDPDKAPPELAELLREVDRQKRGPGVTQQQQPEGEDITPAEGFVVKTKDDTGRKVFINVCGSPKIPAPGNWDNGKVPAQVQEALDKMEQENQEPGDALRFPLSCGEVRNDLDKKGEPASVLDVVLNKDIVEQCASLRRLKVFVIELAMAWVGQKHQLELDAKYKLPHLKYKGSAPAQQRIRIDPKCLIHELDEPEDAEPAFPLLTKARAPTVPLPPQGLRQAAQATSQVMPPPLPSTPATATSFSFASSTTTPGAASSQRAYQHESGAPGGGGGGGLLPTLKARVVFENRPVTEAVVKIELPGRRRASDVTVAVVHEGVDVQVVGAAPLHVSFPFMVDAQRSKTTLQLPSTDSDPAVLTIALPYRAYGCAVEEARLAAPHSFGALGLSNAALMDLE